MKRILLSIKEYDIFELSRKSLPVQAFGCLMALLFIFTGALAGRAFAPDFYAVESKLSSGKWVRVSVSQSGVHCISESQLRSWGFSTPSEVKVYGYGGKRLPESLDSSYLDDLPQVASEYVSGKGVYFYAEGCVGWTQSATDYYVPSQNPFSDNGYYFLSDSGDEERLLPSTTGRAPDDGASFADTFYDRIYHEQELESLGEAGFLLVGEDFRYTSSRSFQFELTGKVDGEPVRMETSFVAKSATTSGSLTFTANGQALPSISSDNIARVTDKYSYGNQSTSRRELNVGGTSLSVGITYHCSGSVTSANLNYIAINYPRSLSMPEEKVLTFYLTSTQRAARLSGASGDTRIWDVTDPQNVAVVEASVSSSVAEWQSSRAGERTYVAWEPGGRLPSPTFVENVGNQNLHGLDVPDMVIFTPKEWKSQAERLAELHRTDEVAPLDVIVLTPQEVFNEFSSGGPDAQSFRKLLKMMYDRDGEKLKYALFFSRPTYDYRRKTTKIQALGYPMLPAWFTDKGLNDNDSYTTDDVYGFLEDESGINVGRDRLCIAVGRIPATSVSEASSAVDKIENYVGKAPGGIWKNNVMLVADDKNNGIHMEDTEIMWQNMMAGTAGSEAFYKKLYIDEYELVGNVCVDGRTQFYRNLDEGVMWWCYLGHANTSSLTGEGLVTYKDLNELYLRHIPIVYAATCEFLRWDAASVSGAEILFKNPNGGVIAAISATRPVYISDNGYLSASFGRELFSRDGNGRIRSIGEIYRDMKNNYRKEQGVISNTNKLRYVLMGDPAMRPTMPSNKVVLEEIGGMPVVDVDEAEEPATLKARQQTTIKGRVTDPSGTLLGDFNGVVSATLYDAEQSITTLGNSAPDDEGKQVTFDQQGGRLFVGSDSIKGGEFTIKVSMPAEVADNYRPAAFNIYASADDGREAIGVCRDFYVYGMDESAEPDTIAPWIESMYLNHPSFKNGQSVNSTPMLIATIYDDRAINMSTAGIGHQMALYLDDGSKSITDVSDFFTPFVDGTPGGSIAYPLEGLAEGWHTLRLRIWDTAPNSAEATLEFSVAEGIAPKVYDVYTDANPASTEANFYISHDRPDGTLTVTIEVFDLTGRCLWSSTETGRSDMFTSHPITWNLCTDSGQRVVGGIYVYRATISDEDSGEKTSTASRKLAVTGG